MVDTCSNYQLSKSSPRLDAPVSRKVVESPPASDRSSGASESKNIINTFNIPSGPELLSWRLATEADIICLCKGVTNIDDHHRDISTGDVTLRLLAYDRMMLLHIPNPFFDRPLP